MDDAKALELAREAFTSSTTYFDTSIRPAIEADMRMFQGVHPSGSKYHTETYRGRSKLFRPKTRTVIRKNEAVAAEAFFSTSDVVNVKPMDESDEVSRLGADVLNPILQYRLTHSIPWFLTCIGAYQEAQVNGVVISYQYWQYDKVKKIDRPCVKLIPVENFRISPAADWDDPIATSPYVIEQIPMYVKDVRRMMKANDERTGQPKWKTYSEAEIKTAVSLQSDPTRLLREGKRTDSKDAMTNIGAYSIAWIHRNIVNDDDGVDYVYYTLGDNKLLTTPKPLGEVYLHDIRPYVMGICAIEAHKLYAGGVARMNKDVQAEINEIANQRIDNVKFAMNKRYFVARNKQVDTRALMRNVVSGVTMMQDVERDVKIVETPDVTSSSYQEQDRLNLDMDDLAGSFSGSSVQSNRKLNETVGGMNLLTTNANQVSGYQLRTFTETWVEPVLNHLVAMERAYETDSMMIELSPEGRAFMKLNGNVDALFAQEVHVKVNVGMGATNPQEQVKNFMSGMTALRELLADGTLEAQGLQPKEVIKEIFGKLGYSDGSRFFTSKDGEDPVVKQLKQKVQQMQQALDAKHPPELLAAEIKKLEAEAVSLGARTTETNVKSQYSAMQAAEVIAAVPGTAPIADEVLKSAGYAPNPSGVDPNLPQPAQADPGLALQAVNDKHTGVGFMPGKNTDPLTPTPIPQPESPAIGAAHGIETQRPDGV